MPATPSVREINGLHTIEGDLSGSPLWNRDIAPTSLAQRTWNVWHIAALWVGMAVCITTYTLASSLISQGMSVWQAIGTIALGNCIVLIPMILNAHAGTKYGIPFPVLARASFGTRGANLPAMLRAFVACGWFGIQTWIGGWAIYQLLRAVWPQLPQGNPSAAWPGTLPFACFIAFWLINVYFIWQGTESIKWMETLAAPFLIVTGLALLAWAYHRAGGWGPMLLQGDQFKSPGDFWKAFWPGLTAMIGYWATLSLNIPDFTRYAKSQRDQALGQAIGLPTTMTLFAFIGAAVTSATIVIYGKAIWDPVDLMGRVGGLLVVLISMIALLVATLSTNVAANVVSPANDISNLAPSKISFKIGGYITAIVGILIMPWRLYSDPTGYIFTWLIGYSALLGPIGGILICDYFFIRRMKLNTPELYKPQGEYTYNGGFNPIAVFSLIMGIAPNIPGFLGTIRVVNPATIGPFLMSLYNYAWFVGFFVAFFAYGGFMTVLGKLKPVRT
jgi:NCS1 family nucleobase:cation symporter-1